jgi:hypothetical protein
MQTPFKSVMVDGQEMQFEGAMTFGSVSESLRVKVAPKRVLTEILVDGKHVDLAEEEILRAKSLEEIGSVALKTRDVVELFQESLELAPKICDALSMDCADIETFFQSGDMRAAQERVSEMTALLEWLLQLVAGMQSLGGLKLSEMKFGGSPVSESMNHMEGLLAKLHVQMTAKDWVSFRATLQGDFAAGVSQWKRLFSDAATQWKPRDG